MVKRKEFPSILSFYNRHLSEGIVVQESKSCLSCKKQKKYENLPPPSNPSTPSCGTSFISFDAY